VCSCVRHTLILGGKFLSKEYGFMLVQVQYFIKNLMEHFTSSSFTLGFCTDEGGWFYFKN
jgi:hypothetical protein